jgi:hypothetical protein
MKTKVCIAENLADLNCSSEHSREIAELRFPQIGESWEARIL